MDEFIEENEFVPELETSVFSTIRKLVMTRYVSGAPWTPLALQGANRERRGDGAALREVVGSCLSVLCD